MRNVARTIDFCCKETNASWWIYRKGLVLYLTLLITQLIYLQHELSLFASVATPLAKASPQRKGEWEGDTAKIVNSREKRTQYEKSLIQLRLSRVEYSADTYPNR